MLGVMITPMDTSYDSSFKKAIPQLKFGRQSIVKKRKLRYMHIRVRDRIA